jgi:histidinol-phosphate aminotransferase
MLPFIRSDLVQFTAYKPHAETNSASPITVDKLDTNESPYDLPRELKEKLAWEYQNLIETNRYPDGGHQKLKNAIADYVNESAHLCSPAFSADNISVGNGSDELIRSLLIATCLQGSGSILVAQPTFSMYAILAQTLGISVVTVARKEENFEIDLKVAQRAIENTQNPPIRAVFVVHPNSPTANPLTVEELAWLRSLPQNILVVIDEAYFEFSQTTLATELPEHSNWVILRTFSKAFRLAAMRVGYCIAHPELTNIVEKVRLPYNLPSFSIQAALIALQNRKILLQSISQTVNERSQLLQTLSQNPKVKVWDSATNFIFLRLQADELEQQAISKEVYLKNVIRQLRSSGTFVREINGGLRITIGTPQENIRTLDRLQVALKGI